MADTDQMNGGLPAPPSPTPPAPPAGAMDKGVTGADPASDPAQSLMAESVRLAGPLGGIAIGAATGAAHHVESQNQPSAPIDKGAQMAKDPDFLALQPNEKIQLLSQVDSQFKSLSPAEQLHIASQLTGQQESDQSNVGNILGEQYLSPQSQSVANKQEAPLAKAETVGLLTGPLGAGVSAAAGGGLVGSMAAGGAIGATQSAADSLSAGENPFRLQMLKDAAIGAGTAGLLHGAGKLIGAVGGGIADKVKGMLTPGETEAAGLPAEVTAEHFTPIPKEETPQIFPHGKPVVGDQPFDNATIASMRQGRTLPTDAANLLNEYVGKVVPSGSTPLNTTMGAVKHVTEAINDTGVKMATLLNEAPPFAQSAIEDAEIGTPLREDLQSMRENLPLGPDSDPRNKIITTQLEANNRALVSNDPQEILAQRRKLSDQIDWDNIKKNPETDQETKNAAQARIYQALTDKLKQIPGMKELDQVFQPNLELRSYLDKILPEGVAYDPVEAESQRMLEFKKGQKVNAINAHNERVAKNISTAKKVIAAGAVGATAVVGGMAGGALRHAGNAAIPAQ